MVKILKGYALGLLALLLTCFPLFAGSALPFPISFTQPNGVQFQAYVKGDEHLAWHETLDGFSFCKNKATGFWEFAETRGKNGQLIPSGKRVAIDQAPAAAKGFYPHGQHDHHHRLEKTPGKVAIWDPRPQSGTRNLLVVLVGFADQDITTDPASWHRNIFGTSPEDKSVVRFYKENSFGKVDIQPVATSQPGYPNGLVYAKLDENHPNYGRGDDFDSSADHNRVESDWLRKALEKIDPFVDFRSYDQNTSNFLGTNELNVYFVVAGYDTSVSSNTPSIWAHAWSAFRGNEIFGDGVQLANWAMSGELENSGSQNPFGVIAHELGHSIFGLPDLYDTAGVNSGVGFFSVMGTGSFGRLREEQLNGMTPGPMDPWCRFYLGWSEPRTFTNAQVADFPGGLSRPNATVMLPIKDSEEFFLAENFYPETIWHEGVRFLMESPEGRVTQDGNTFQANVFTYSPGGTISGRTVRSGLGKPGEFPADVAGNIALIQRGEITFRDKVLNAKQAGAIGAIVFNNTTGINRGTLGEPDDYIPSVSMAPEAANLAGLIVEMKVETFPWDGGLMVLHIDPNSGRSINNSENNDNQGVVIEEASQRFGTFSERGVFGHVTHLFSGNGNSVFNATSTPNSNTYQGQPSGVGLSKISLPGPVMTARITRDEAMSYVVPWIVNNAQWSSRLALYNAGNIAESPKVTAIDRNGLKRTVELNPIGPKSVVAIEAADLFADLSGYSLKVYASKTVYPSFLTFNLNAPSGGSPAQTTGMATQLLDQTLIFGYLPSDNNGTAALVLVAPEATEGLNHNVTLSLHDSNGVVIADKTVALNGANPFAVVVADLFGVSGVEGAVVARSNNDLKLAGTTFAFNSQLEPAMALPFPNRPETQFALPWIVNNSSWSSRIALYNDQLEPATVKATAVDREGQKQQLDIQIPGKSLWAAESGTSFPGLSGYGLILDSDKPLFSNFLAFNLNAASGRSPAQTTGSPLSQLNDSLVFPYVPFSTEGVSALVVMAPLSNDATNHDVFMELLNGSGEIVDTVRISLKGKQPFAAVISDVFTVSTPEALTVVARSASGEKLTGTTFVFNGSNEPSMSRALTP